MKLQAKFNLVMLASFGVGLLPLSGVLLSRMVAHRAQDHLRAEAALMLDQIDATIRYNDQQVTPLLTERSGAVFLPQAVPFYAAQQNARVLMRGHPGLVYRQPALNPTNPGDRPEAWEKAAIDRFVADPSLSRLEERRETADGAVLSVLKPIKVDSAACLTCHSTPAAAPPAMIDAYGGQNGFGWKLDETVGAQAVSIPESSVVARSRADMWRMMALLTGIFAIGLALANVALRYVIIAPVRRLAGLAENVSLGDMSAPAFEAERDDEIGTLAQAFNRLRRSVVTAMGLLDQ